MLDNYSAPIAVMNLLPADANVKAASPLSHIAAPENSDEHQNICLKEEKYLGHIVLRGNSENESIKKGIKNILGCDLPAQLQCSYCDNVSIRWISPDEWLIICASDKAYELETALRKKLSGHYSLCDVSGGQTLLVLSGNQAQEVLMKSTSYDVADCHFPVGKAVTTTLAKSQAIICRKDKNTWELVIRRSFSDYIWQWLQDACFEFRVIEC